MRIILDDDYCSTECNCDICESTKGLGINITDAEWDGIYDGYDEWETNNLHKGFEPTFARYLKELIKIARSK